LGDTDGRCVVKIPLEKSLARTLARSSQTFKSIPKTAKAAKRNYSPINKLITDQSVGKKTIERCDLDEPPLG
jgi:hypothetical protein